MATPLSLNDLAETMRKQQENPKAAAPSRTVWDAEKCAFVHLAPNEEVKPGQTSMNTLAKEPYFA